jgi:hypothetical protein
MRPCVFFGKPNVADNTGKTAKGFLPVDLPGAFPLTAENFAGFGAKAAFRFYIAVVNAERLFIVTKQLQQSSCLFFDVQHCTFSHFLKK